MRYPIKQSILHIVSHDAMGNFSLVAAVSCFDRKMSKTFFIIILHFSSFCNRFVDSGDVRRMCDIMHFGPKAF